MKMKQAHKDKISMAQKERWQRLREDWTLTNAELVAAGESTYKFREFIQMQAPTGAPDAPIGRKTRALSDEHKEKLRKIAIERNYVKNLQPYWFKKKYKTPQEREIAKRARQLKGFQNSLLLRQNLKFAGEAVYGVHGDALRMSILTECAGADRTDRNDMLKVVYYLVEIGILEMPVSKVSLATRKKMSEAAKRRVERERNAKVLLGERVSMRKKAQAKAKE